MAPAVDPVAHIRAARRTNNTALEFDQRWCRVGAIELQADAPTGVTCNDGSELTVGELVLVALHPKYSEYSSACKAHGMRVLGIMAQRSVFKLLGGTDTSSYTPRDVQMRSVQAAAPKTVVQRFSTVTGRRAVPSSLPHVPVHEGWNPNQRDIFNPPKQFVFSQKCKQEVESAPMEDQPHVKSTSQTQYSPTVSLFGVDTRHCDARSFTPMYFPLISERTDAYRAAMQHLVSALHDQSEQGNTQRSLRLPTILVPAPSLAYMNPCVVLSIRNAAAFLSHGELSSKDAAGLASDGGGSDTMVTLEHEIRGGRGRAKHITLQISCNHDMLTAQDWQRSVVGIVCSGNEHEFSLDANPYRGTPEKLFHDVPGFFFIPSQLGGQDTSEEIGGSLSHAVGMMRQWGVNALTVGTPLQNQQALASFWRSVDEALARKFVHLLR